MYLLETAIALLASGRSIDQVRAELRASENSAGVTPTCSYVEEVLQAALKRREKKHAQRRRYRNNRKFKRAAAMTVELVHNSDVSVYRVVGERVHEVIVDDDKAVSCDCGNEKSPCAHVIAVRDWTIDGLNRIAQRVGLLAK